MVEISTEIIVMTGPESTGKTTLAVQLSDYWKAELVPEFAREYLSDKTRYQQHDLLEIAKRQQKQEEALLTLSSKRIICDTDLLVIIVWSEVKYGHCDPWIYSTFENCIRQKATSRLYCLCDYNIPWQADPLRENPHNRAELFDLYLQKLKEYDLDFKIVTGDAETRMQQVVGNLSLNG